MLYLKTSSLSSLESMITVNRVQEGTLPFDTLSSSHVVPPAIDNLHV
jgi:hypothetical protein